VTIQMVSMLGALGCILALVGLAVVATLTDNEPPIFTYLTGIALAIAALLLFVNSGMQ
jgi:ATP-dependent protease ClpP protease subunit